MCRNKFEINIILTIYSIFYSLGGLLFFTLPDKIGRLSSFQIFSTMSLISQLIITFVPVYWIKMIGFIIFGFSQMKSSLCYVYLFEFLHSKDKSFSCSCVNFLDALTPAFAGVFFLFIEVDVYPLYAMTVTMSTLAYLAVIALNLETPMWLLL